MTSNCNQRTTASSKLTTATANVTKDADALRLYLINSPVVRVETLRFKKDGVFTVVEDVFLPWYNAYRFLVQNAKRLEVERTAPFIPSDLVTLKMSSNVLEKWINSGTRSLVHFVRLEMEGYRLYTVNNL